MSLPSTRSRSHSFRSGSPHSSDFRGRPSRKLVDIDVTDAVDPELYGKKSTCAAIPRSGWLMILCTFLMSYVDHRLLAVATVATSLTGDGENLFNTYMRHYILALTVGMIAGGISDFMCSRKCLVIVAHIAMIFTFFGLYMSYNEELVESNDLMVMCIFCSVHGVFRVLVIESFDTNDRRVISMGVGLSKLAILAGRLLSALVGASIYIVLRAQKAATMTNATITWVNISGVICSACVISVMAHFVTIKQQPILNFSTLIKLLLTCRFREIREAWRGKTEAQEAFQFRTIKRFMLLVLLVVPWITTFFIGNCLLYMFRTPFSLMQDKFNWPTLLTMDAALWALSIPYLVVTELFVQVVCKILRRDSTLTFRILLGIIIGFGAYWGTLFFLEANVHQVTGNLPTATTAHVRFVNALSHPVKIVPKDKKHATHIISEESSVMITFTKLGFKSAHEELFELELHAVTERPYKYATFIAMKYKHTSVYVIWDQMELRRVDDFEPLSWPTAELAYGAARVYFATLHDSKFARMVLTPYTWNEFTKSREITIVEVPQGERKVFHIVPDAYMLSFDLTGISEYVAFERHGIYGIVYYTQVPGGRVNHFQMYTILEPIKTPWIYASLLQTFGYSSVFFVFIKIEVFLFLKAPPALRGMAFSIFRFCEDAPFLAAFLIAKWSYGDNIDIFFGYMVSAVHGGFVIATIFILVKFKHFFKD